MIKSLLSVCILVCVMSSIGLSQSPSLHVESDLRVDPLAGSGNRPVYANSNGTLLTDDSQVFKQLMFPAQSLNIADQTIITRNVSTGLTWERDWAASANITIQKPIDFDATGGPVTLTIYYYPTTTNGGSIRFFSRPKDYNVYDLIVDEFNYNSNIEFSIGEKRLLTAQINFPAHTLTKDLWHICIQRDTAFTYPDDVIVMSVTLQYPASH